MSRAHELPVLIVGAGPSGTMMALLLRRLGIEARIVERRNTLQRAPAAHVVSARSFEICRAAGVDAAAIERASLDPADAGHVHFAVRFGGEILGSLPFEGQGRDHRALTPTPLRNLSQNRFEPLLQQALADAGGSAPRWGWQWESMNDAGDGEGVVSRLRNLGTDEVEEVHSRYVVAADGAGSRVRKALGIAMEGPDRLQAFVMVHFRAALRGRTGDPPGVLFFVLEPATGGGAFIIHDPDREAVYMHPFDPDAESLDDYDASRCEQVVRSAMALDDLPFEIESISSWAMSAQVAERYRGGNSFLVGDAAHRFPPTGGLGLNTGMQDVHNLAWKLAAVLRGQAGDALLETYEQERRPVAKTNSEQSLKNALTLIQVPASLGISDKSEASRQRMLAVLADPEKRALAQEAVANQAEHFDMPGLQLGFCYAEGALRPDPKDPAPDPPNVRVFQPSGRPGARLPHAWLAAKQGKREASLLDRVPLGRCLLIAGPSGEAWLRAAGALDAERVEVLHARAEEFASEGELARWLEVAGLAAEGALLVRPDQHVAWRSREAAASSEIALEDLERALGAVFLEH